ncbi:MAG: hypothetical protein ABI263_06675 [Gelidibacter sp.]
MKRLVYISFVLVIGNFQVALAQLDAIQKLDDFVLRGVNLKSFGRQFEGNAIADLKLNNDYEIYNNANAILKIDTDDILDGNYKNIALSSLILKNSIIINPKNLKL